MGPKLRTLARSLDWLYTYWSLECPTRTFCNATPLVLVRISRVSASWIRYFAVLVSRQCAVLYFVDSLCFGLLAFLPQSPSGISCSSTNPYTVRAVGSHWYEYRKVL